MKVAQVLELGISHYTHFQKKKTLSLEDERKLKNPSCLREDLEDVYGARYLSKKYEEKLCSDGTVNVD